MSKWKEFCETLLLLITTFFSVQFPFSECTELAGFIERIVHIPNYFPLLVILVLSYFIVRYRSRIWLKISPKARAKRLGGLISDFVGRVNKEGRSPQALSELLYLHTEALKFEISFPDHYTEIQDMFSKKFFQETFYYLSIIYPFLERGDIEGAKAISVATLI